MTTTTETVTRTRETTAHVTVNANLKVHTANWLPNPWGGGRFATSCGAEGRNARVARLYETTDAVTCQRCASAS